MNLKHYLFITLAAMLLTVSPARAAVVPFSGSVNVGPTFNRPVSLTGLSGTGTAVYFTVLPFTVDTTGGYTITQTTPTYDGYLLEYITLFNPATPLVNLINGDDDFDPDGTGPLTSGSGSQITATGGGGNFAATNNLTASTPYYLVSTTFANGVTGAFTGTIDGPGIATIVSVPEPSTWAFLGLGGSLLGLALRRRFALV